MPQVPQWHDATANNRRMLDNKHVIFCCNFLECVVTEVVFFSIVAFNKLTFHKVMQ